MLMENKEGDATARQSLGIVVSRFSLGSKSKYFSSARLKPLPVLNEGESAGASLDGAGNLHGNSSRWPTSKKRDASEVSGSSKPPSKKKKTSRPYAPPETYAHLAHLPDYLKVNLDGKLGSYPWEQILMNGICSRLLWHKVSHVPRASVMASEQKPVQP